ncbi:MAG: NAD(P)/FAD-dependent oxidoreductase [Thermodesulfobacteriota bacterium]|nr:NAD(P)/FAD-dependent oxidoreductase [Thermodesulfobacteriota bacterium]
MPRSNCQIYSFMLLNVVQERMGETLFDCVVVGLGPAGAITAYTLARAGWSVLALDKRVHPRPKTCGGCLSRKVDAILPFSISPVIEHHINEVAFTFKGQGEIAYRLTEPFAYIVRRERFDQFLAAKAVEAGATVRQGEGAISLTGSENGVSVETKTGCYRGRVLVGADGVQGIVARRLGEEYGHSSSLALEAETGISRMSYAPAHPRPGSCIWIDVGWVDFGYGWIFPRRPSYSVGIADSGGTGQRLKEAFSNLFASHGLLTGEKPATINGYRIPLSTAENRKKKVVSNRVALIGDTAGLVNPLTGEGIYYALWSGLILAACLIEHSKDHFRALSNYERRIRTELHPQLAVAERVARLLYSHPRANFRLIGKHRELIGLFIEGLTGREGFSDLLSMLKCKIGLKDKIAG